MGNGVPVDKIRVRCDCGAGILAPAALAGSQVSCPRCDRLVRVVESIEDRPRPRIEPARRPPPRPRPAPTLYEDEYPEEDGAYEPAPRRAPRGSARPRTRIVVRTGGPSQALPIGLAAAFFLGMVILVVVVRTNAAREAEKANEKPPAGKTGGGPAQPTAPEPPPPPPQKIESYSIGMKFDAGAFSCKVTALRVLPSIAGATPARGLGYIAVEVETSNGGKDPVEFPRDSFSLLDNLNKPYKPSALASAAYATVNPKRFPGNPIPPGATRLFPLVFELPDLAFGASALLQIATGEAGAKEVTVVLRLPRSDGTVVPRL